MNKDNVMLRVDDLTVRYGTHVTVDHVNFTVEPGQWLMIIGPNGAGKSTIINAISQGIKYEGTCSYEGRDLAKCKARERAQNLGVLSQNHFVGYDFTVEEVIRMGRYAYAPKMFSQERDVCGEELVQSAIQKTGMEPYLKQSVLTLSGGELQRTFLAQLFAQNPRLLLLDEPTNHLDLIYQKQTFALIKEWLKEEGRAVVSVVHDLSLAKAYGTHAMLMSRGQVKAMGKMEDVMKPELLNTTYNMDVYQWMGEMYSQWK
ncbi:MAG: ABC transporter ATP-binding protein [Firmicutes bacterium]|nr:ABC transporter ATP-binding protein [Bacillota bacterium]